MGDVEMGAASGSSRSRSARSVTFNPSSAAVEDDDNGGSSSSDTEDEFDPVESKNLEEEEGLFRSQSMLDFSSRSSGLSDEGMKRSNSFSIDSLRMRRREEAFLLRQSTLIMRGPRILHMKGEELDTKNVSLELQAKHDLVALGESAGPRPEELAKLEEQNSNPISTRSRDPLLKSRTQSILARALLIREEVFTPTTILKQFASVLKEAKAFDVRLSTEHGGEGGEFKTIAAGDPTYGEALFLALESATLLEPGKRNNRGIFRCDVFHGRGYMVLSIDDQGSSLPSPLMMEGKAFSEVSLVANQTERVVLVARLGKPTAWSATGRTIHFVALVICCQNLPATANHLSTAHTFATLLSSEDFYVRAMESRKTAAMCRCVLDFVNQNLAKQERWLKRRQRKRKEKGGEGEDDEERNLRVQIEETSMTSMTLDKSEDVPFKKRGGCCPLPQTSKTSRKSQRKRAKSSSLIFTGRCLGILNDLIRLFKNYRSEWVVRPTVTDWFKVASGTIWQLFATIAPAISIGLVYNDVTGGAIGVTEILISEACCGIVYALCGSLSIGVFRSTGPLLAYVKILYKWSADNYGSLDFLLFYAWTGIWLGIWLTVAAVAEVSVLTRYCGRFTEEILALMVSMVFVVSACEELTAEITQTYDLSFVCLFMGTFSVSSVLSRANKSRFITKIMRQLITDLAPALSIVLLTGLSYSVPEKSKEILRVPMSTEPEPFSTTTGRSWLVNMWAVGWQEILFCAIPGLFLFLLYITEANIGALLTCRPGSKLRSGPPYLHYDLLLSGLLAVGCSVLGLPICMVSLPHSPMNVFVLGDTAESVEGREVVVRSREIRWPGLVSHLIMLALVGWASSWIATIPVGVAFGFLLYMGVESMISNDILQRVLLLVTDPQRTPPTHYTRFVRFGVTMRFTIIQAAAFVFLWCLHDNFYSSYLDTLPFSLAMLFPLFLLLMVPLRLFILPMFFTRLDLELLTAVEDHLIAKLFY